MTKHELDQLVFWFQERQELTKFRDSLNYCSEAGLITTTIKTWSILIASRSYSFKDEYKLTEIQRIKLWAFLNEEINHLDNLISNAGAEDRDIAESVFKGNVGKVALGIEE